MEQLASILKEIKQQSHSYAQVTISGDLFSRLLAATNEMRQEFVQLQQEHHSQRVKLHNLESLQRDWDAKAELAEVQMANWANQLSQSMNLVKSQILREQEITAMWIGHVQREKDKNRFLESNMKIRNEEYSNLKVEFATLSEALRKARGENEILHAAYEKAQKNESIAFQKKSDAEKELKQQSKVRGQLVNQHKQQQAEWETAMQEVQAELTKLRSNQMEANTDTEKLHSRVREAQEALAERTEELDAAQATIQKDIKILKGISALFVKGFSGKIADFDMLKNALGIPELPRMKSAFLECITEYPKLQKEHSTLKSNLDKALKQLEESKKRSAAGDLSKDKLSSKNTKSNQLDEERPRMSLDRTSQRSRDAKSSGNRGTATRPAIKMDEEPPVKPKQPATKKKGLGAAIKPEKAEQDSLRDDSPNTSRNRSGVSRSSEPAPEPPSPKKTTKAKNGGKATKKGAGAKSKASVITKSDVEPEENEWNPSDHMKKPSRRSHSVDAKQDKGVERPSSPSKYGSRGSDWPECRCYNNGLCRQRQQVRLRPQASIVQPPERPGPSL